MRTLRALCLSAWAFAIPCHAGEKSQLVTVHPTAEGCTKIITQAISTALGIDIATPQK